MSRFQELVDRLRLYDPEDLELGEGATEAEISDAESALEVKFAGAYLEFLRTHGRGEICSVDVWGIGAPYVASTDVVRMTRSEREEVAVPVPAHLVPFHNDGWGNLYCLDTRDAIVHPVVFWNHELDVDQVPDVVAEDFVDWLFEQLDWVDEERAGKAIDCCREVKVNATDVVSPFDATLVWGYYDGVTDGFTQCVPCGSVLSFEKLDWDDSEDLRVFSFARVKEGPLHSKLLDLIDLARASSSNSHWLKPGQLNEVRDPHACSGAIEFVVATEDILGSWRAARPMPLHPVDDWLAELGLGRGTRS